jgi:hypothetical protein
MASNPGSTAGEVARAPGFHGNSVARASPSWPSRVTLPRPSAVARRLSTRYAAGRRRSPLTASRDTPVRVRDLYVRKNKCRHGTGADPVISPSSGPMYHGKRGGAPSLRARGGPLVLQRRSGSLLAMTQNLVAGLCKVEHMCRSPVTNVSAARAVLDGALRQSGARGMGPGGTVSVCGLAAAANGRRFT